MVSILSIYKANVKVSRPTNICARYLIFLENKNGSIARNKASPAKHRYLRLPRKCDYQTDAEQSDPNVPLCIVGNITRYPEEYAASTKALTV